MLAAWTGSMQNSRVRSVANTFLCPSLQTAEDYRQLLKHAGLKIRAYGEITGRVMHTWRFASSVLASWRALISILSREVREFVHGINTILEAYRSGDLTYSVMVAQK